MKNLKDDAWGTHALENQTASIWSDANVAPIFDQIENTLKKSKHPFELRTASFWLYKLGQWFPDHFHIPALITLSLKRLKPLIENEELDLYIKNAIKEDIAQLERFQKEVGKV